MWNIFAWINKYHHLFMKLMIFDDSYNHVTVLTTLILNLWSVIALPVIPSQPWPGPPIKFTIAHFQRSNHSSRSSLKESKIGGIQWSRDGPSNPEIIESLLVEGEILFQYSNIFNHLKWKTSKIIIYWQE